ncbi:hypothetical protein [Myroides fluvii]|uniref:hypothetical protein n=1 Tax=Myroides fluvii TaxID=2572594 RepID=UPI00131D9D0D|nr:hypothetical protein [Myroides fluvii]
MDIKNQTATSTSKQEVLEQEILNHNQAVRYLELAVKHHFDAARHFENGNLDKANACSAKAQNSTNRAVKFHSKIENKQLNEGIK